MKLTDILNERRELPTENRIDVETLKEFIFKDWQIFNERVVPTFKHLRNKVVKEAYSGVNARNNFYNIANFAAKKYIAEKTDRKYKWNEVFLASDRARLAEVLCEYFEKYNLDEEYGLITEQEGGQKKGRASFSDIEIEIIGNKPLFILNFNFDESTQNFITTATGKGQNVSLSNEDFELMKGQLKVSLKNASDMGKLSYLKLIVIGSSISRIDLKTLVGGAFLNRLVTLEVGTPQTQAQEPVAEPEPTAAEPEPTAPAVSAGQAATAKYYRGKQGTDFVREIADNSIREILGDKDEN